MFVVHYERSAGLVFLVADAMKQSQCRVTINFHFANRWVRHSGVTTEFGRPADRDLLVDP